MDPLEAIWNQVSKPVKGGGRFIFFKDQGDIAYLYASGFVDAKKYTFKQWLDSFTPCKQADGSYLIDQARWTEKKKYHYRGPVNPPFDPMELEERDYTEAELAKLIKEKVIPATVFDEQYLKTYLGNLKAQGRLVDGKIKIDRPVKQFMLQVLNAYPSPMRVLEVSVHGLRNVKKGRAKNAQANLQKSGFSAGQAAHQIFAGRLAELAGTSSKKEEKPSSTAPAISLKDLRKKRTTPGRI